MEIVTAEDIIAAYTASLRGSSSSVRGGRVAWVRKYLAYCDGDYSSDRIRAYWDSLEASGYASGTVRLAISIAKIAMKVGKEVHSVKMRELARDVDPSDPEANTVLLQAISMGFPEWPLPNREMPKVKRDKIAPKFTDDEVRCIIDNTQKGVLSSMEAAFVALASVYGFRKMEIANITPADVDLDKMRISHDPEKGGSDTPHRIPNEIASYIKAHDWSTYISKSGMWKMMNGILEKCGIDKQEGLSWHSWRRSVITSLQDAGLPDIVITKYIGWADRSVSDGYYTKEAAEIDNMVFEVHPILAMWRGVC